jgi:hypothetical protein
MCVPVAYAVKAVLRKQDRGMMPVARAVPNPPILGKNQTGKVRLQAVMLSHGSRRNSILIEY